MFFVRNFEFSICARGPTSNKGMPGMVEEDEEEEEEEAVH